MSKKLLNKMVKNAKIPSDNITGFFLFKAKKQDYLMIQYTGNGGEGERKMKLAPEEVPVWAKIIAGPRVKRESTKRQISSAS